MCLHGANASYVIFITLSHSKKAGGAKKKKFLRKKKKIDIEFVFRQKKNLKSFRLWQKTGIESLSSKHPIHLVV